MSRSYKRAWIKGKSRWAQKLAARRIRRMRSHVEIPDGMAYKKFYDRYSISDWCWMVYPPDAKWYFYRRRPELLAEELEEFFRHHFYLNKILYRRT